MAGSSRKNAEASDGTSKKKLRFSMSEGPPFDSQPIRVLVGKAKTPIYVYEALLRANSPFFENVLKEPWREGEERTITLAETRLEIFKIYVQWLYTGRLFCTKEDDETIDDSVDERLDAEYDRWSYCYEFANFLQSSDFKDALIDTAIEKTIEDESYSPDLADIIYEHSSKDSANRKMAIDTIVYVWDRREWEQLLPNHSTKDILIDMIAHISFKLEEGVKECMAAEFFDMNDTCKYHEHTQHGKPCYRTTTGYRF